VLTRDAVSRVRFEQQFLVSGDDSGQVKVWDARADSSVLEYREQGEAVSGIAARDRFLLTTSLDGTLAVYDTALGSGSKGLLALSDSMDNELLGVEVVKGGEFVACNSSEGAIYLFKWDWFGDCKDRVTGHPNSIGAMVKYDEQTLLTGAEDGFVRAVGLFPNRVARTLGQHDQDSIFPVERLALRRDLKLLASTSHDESINFYDLSEFEGAGEPEEQEEEEKEGVSTRVKGKLNLKEREGEIGRMKRADFFSDL
jgi:WD40 repeat protein